MTLHPVRRTTRSGHLGLDIAVEETANGKPDVLFVHANGFCKELWRPVIDAIDVREPVHWRTMDLRGHGESAAGEAPYSWETVARDVLGIVEDLDAPVVGVGHSLGAAAIAMAEILVPGTFSSMILVEPIILPPPFERWEIPLVDAALGRRRSFADRATAADRFARGPFRDWVPEALDLYLDHGFMLTSDGWTLRCDPEVEADYYREGKNHDTWDRAHEIESSVVIVAGERSDSHQEPFLTALSDRFAAASIVVLQDSGHLVPMEQPQKLAKIISTTLSRYRVEP